MHAFGRSIDSFDGFQDSIKASTWKHHDAVLDWALAEAQKETVTTCGRGENPLVARGWELQKEAQRRFRDKQTHLGKTLRILVHVPDFAVSPGGFSLFSNMIDALRFIGVPAEPFRWGDSTEKVLKDFHPTCMLTSDHVSYLEKIDWNVVRSWKELNGLLLGLTASLKEYGNTVLEPRLAWAKENRVDFYFSFRTRDYLHARPEYKPFFEEGFSVFSIEFGANASCYYPVEHETKDLDYVFLASSNPDKQERYFQFLTPIVRKYHGFIDGPGWKNISRYAPRPVHKFIYARARIGLNLHIPENIVWANEINERTYILAACGIPQVIDTPKLLPRRFSSGCFYVADSSRQYLEAFKTALHDKRDSQAKAARALEEVFANHTTYHRADAFVQELNAHFGDVLRAQGD
jgi:hypothetical protein